LALKRSAVTQFDDLSSRPDLDTEQPHPVARPSPARLAVTTTGFIFLLFATVGWQAQMVNVAVGIWFTELFILLGFAWVSLRANGYEPVRCAGLSRPHLRTAAFGFALGLVNFFALVVPIQAVAQSLAPPSWRELWDITNLFKNQTRLELGLILGGLMLAAPFCEEFVFRGVLQRGLLSARRSPAFAVVVAAAVFSGFHLDPIGFAARFELGVVFGLLFLRTGSLWPGVLAHSANNFIATALYFGFGGKQLEEAQPSWIAIFSVALFGISLLIALIALAKKDPLILERRAPEETRVAPVSWRRAARPWIAGAVLILALLAVAGHRSLVLGWYDLQYALPPLRESALPQERMDRQRLDALRAQAQQGKASLESYRARREQLFRAWRADGSSG
jgi:membrane protease YdiL (CAAX protease family)